MLDNRAAVRAIGNPNILYRVGANAAKRYGTDLEADLEHECIGTAAEECAG